MCILHALHSNLALHPHCHNQQSQILVACIPHPHHHSAKAPRVESSINRYRYNCCLWGTAAAIYEPF
jgi:hypothetical protein